jgi:hypothetical protein
MTKTLLQIIEQKSNYIIYSILLNLAIWPIYINLNLLRKKRLKNAFFFIWEVFAEQVQINIIRPYGQIELGERLSLFVCMYVCMYVIRVAVTFATLELHVCEWEGFL